MTSLEVCGAGLKHAGWQDYAFAAYIQPVVRRGSSLPQSRFLAAFEMTMIGVVEACLDTLLLVIPRSRSDEESAVLQFWSKADFSLPLEMTMFGVVSRACPQICCTHE